MASGWYTRAARGVADGTTALASDTFKAMLLANTYTPDVDHDFVADVNAHELSGTGYTGGFSGAGRKTLSGVSFATVDAEDRVKVLWGPETWAGIDAGTARYAVIVKEVTTDADSLLVAFLDLANSENPTGRVTDGGDLTVVLNASAGTLQLVTA